jgi:cytochrome c oxidase subunit 2
MKAAHENTRRRRSRFVPRIGLVLLLAACGGSQSSLEPEGPFAEEISTLFAPIFWIAVVIFVLVEGAIIIAVIKFRQRPGDETKQVKQVHGNTRLEVVWTIIPAVLLAVIAVPTVATLFDLSEEPEGEFLNISVTGHQWWWELEYPDNGGFITANELHIPAGELVYLTMTSADVIHSYWVPPLNGKRDLVPGRITHLKLEADEPTPDGEPILGQCAEFCGLSHADMRIRVFVHTPEEFEEWTQRQNQLASVPTEGPAAQGWETFRLVCAACHAVDGTEAQAQLAPNLTHFASRTTFGGATFANTLENLHTWLEDPPAMKPMDPEFNDIAAGRILGMPDLGLTNSEIANLIALLETWQ